MSELSLRCYDNGQRRAESSLPFEPFEVTLQNLEVSEVITLDGFWDEHYPGLRFIYEDKLRNLRKIVYFDSDISHEADSACAITAKFRLIEG